MFDRAGSWEATGTASTTTASATGTANAGSCAWRMNASALATAASTPPDAPSRCPVAPLIELIFSLEACSPKAVLYAFVSSRSERGVAALSERLAKLDARVGELAGSSSDAIDSVRKQLSMALAEIGGHVAQLDGVTLGELPDAEAVKERQREEQELAEALAEEDYD